jgi:hypothetical protein
MHVARKLYSRVRDAIYDAATGGTTIVHFELKYLRLSLTLLGKRRRRVIEQNRNAKRKTCIHNT